MMTSSLLDVDILYLEPTVEFFARGQQILSRHPNAQRIDVPSHWNIPGLHGNEGLVADWIKTKKTVLVLGVKKGMTFRPNGRSADFIAPSTANGCAMACAYCYVPRRKGYANPITIFVNIEQICRAIEDHARKKKVKVETNTVDPQFWVYEIGENSDCSVDALLSDNIRDLIDLHTRLPNAKATFATKFINRELLDYDPQRKTRVRFSLMPPRIAKVVDVRTSPIPERIAAINDFVEAGYEAHLNFSPVILYEGWQKDWAELFESINDTLSPSARAQLACEVIFLTHNEQLHEVNLGWHPRAEELLWTPSNQELKHSQMGGINVRYRSGFKGKMVAALLDTLEQHLPGCPVRYAF
jgi:spore photoproduct lyase family protein